MLRTTDNHFIDSAGRQVILHGVNMVCKDKSRQYIGQWDIEDIKKLKQWGMNVIRLGVIWDGLEPEPGMFHDAYIEKLRRFIQLAAEHEVMVILDMHQDLYSAAYASGAPTWATITDGEIYEPGPVWSDAYLFNPAVQHAFDHFWANTAAPDGIGIQDHFIQAWTYLVEKLHVESNVIGYDLMNEPFIGGPVEQVNEALFSTFAEKYRERYGDIYMETLIAAWGAADKKLELLSLLDDIEVFTSVIDATTLVLQPFEKHILTSFYRDVTSAIRPIDQTGILFLETNYFSNLGVESRIEPIRDAKGNKDRNQAYAPHAYDLVTDTDASHLANGKRLEVIFNRHERTRQRLKMPMVIGEWGAFYQSDSCAHVSLYIQRLLEALLCGDTYWHYEKDMDQSTAFLGVQRGYPMAVAGELLTYRYEHIVRAFHMSWSESDKLTQPTIIYLPSVKDIQITLTPIGSEYEVEKLAETDAGIVKIPVVGNWNRNIVITEMNQ